MPKGGNNLTLLPSMLSSSKSEYLSTLYSALYASEEPFQHFVKTSGMFLKISRKAFKHVWPHLKVTLQTDDALFNVVSLFTIAVTPGRLWLKFDIQGYQRVLEKRGRIHNAVRASLRAYFIAKRFSPADIVDWVQWFCSTHGSPVFYETPVSQDGAWDTKDPNYQVHRSLLLHSFYI
jgi:hypothetical protein